MDIFEFLMVISVAVVLPVMIVKLIVDYKRERLEVERNAQDVSGALTVRELKKLIREVVEETTTPLAKRVDALERDEPFGTHEEPGREDLPERTVGRRTV